MTVLDQRRPITEEEIAVLCKTPNVNRSSVRQFLEDVNGELDVSVTVHLAQLANEQKVFKLGNETFKAIRRGIYITQSEEVHLERMKMAGAAQKNSNAKTKGGAAVADKIEPVQQTPCLCGCGGQPGRGSMFLPGHDAKLKGYLRRGEVSPESVPQVSKDRLINSTPTWEQYFLTADEGGVAGVGNVRAPSKKKATTPTDVLTAEAEAADEADVDAEAEEEFDEEYDDDVEGDDDEEDEEDEEE